jgi:3-isopropylmalate/(R)-2-methylmalate dehydratase small subunit
MSKNGNWIGGGRAWVFGDDITTDVLAPGLYMKGPVSELARHCLEAVDAAFATAVKPGDVVVGGMNFGMGSSREQAAQALKELGVAAVIARSFGGIFYRNALNLGLPVLVCAEAGIIGNKDSVEIDAEAGVVRIGGTKTIPCEPIPGFLMDMVRDGGLVPHLERRLAAGKSA